MPTLRLFSSARVRDTLAAIAVFLLFGLPLFVGLDRFDLHNDEAIYSYSVDKILETDEWLTPRSIQVDGPFLEKPPLKFWLVAGLMRAGLLPHDEGGQRAIDAIFGGLAFAYVFAIGRRLAGGICGAASVLVLFSLDRLVFEHGLRSNNMEAALLVAYCGGVYHFARWQERTDAPGARWHALAVAGYFALAFMMKFVAALFLPIVCAAAFLWQPDAGARLRATWRQWLVPAVVAVALIAPWFVYQTVQSGLEVWAVIFGEHVFTRFTASLDPQHLRPWHFYYVETWLEFAREGAQWIAGAGVVLLAVQAWRGQPWLARLVLVWGMLPYILLSAGTSKIFHYAYPFLPPVAMAAGYASAAIARTMAAFLTGIIGRAIAMAPGLASPQRMATASTAYRAVLTVGVAIAFACAVAAFVTGGEPWRLGGKAFENESIAGPIAIGGALLFLRGSTPAAAATLAVLPLLGILPVHDYPPTIGQAKVVNHPLRALRDCGVTVRNSGTLVGNGVYNAAPTLTYRSYYYYLRDFGRWTEVDRPDPKELRRRLFDAGAQTPVVMSLQDYRTVVPAIGPDTVPAGTTLLTLEADSPVILLPGPFAGCIEPAVRAGGYLLSGDDVFENHR